MIISEKFYIDVPLVEQLIKTQFPQWINLPVRPVEFSGWDNKTFHLGENMIVRLPSAAHYASQVEKEHHWLPKLAPFLPLPIPTPLAMGKPMDEYPWHWSIYSWLDGKTSSIERINDLSQFATALGNFLSSLQQINATSGPAAGAHNFYRGGMLKTYDVETRQKLSTLKNENNIDDLTAVWETALASTWNSSPVWVHGDVAIGNLLVKNGCLSAVIDFGCMGVGDPACDLVIAWTLFKGESRNAFRKAIPLDNPTWARARGWALWKALCAPLPGTNDIESKRVINEVIFDHKNTKSV